MNSSLDTLRAVAVRVSRIAGGRVKQHLVDEKTYTWIAAAAAEIGTIGFRSRRKSSAVGVSMQLEPAVNVRRPRY